MKQLNFYRVGTGSEKTYVVVIEMHPIFGGKRTTEKAFATNNDANEYIKKAYKNLSSQGIFFRIWLDETKTVTQRYQLRNYGKK